MTPHFSWGFSFARTEAYKKQILQAQLARSPQWLRLGHYRKHFTGSYYSVIKGNFFISPDGSKNPQEELLATIDFLFSDKTPKDQGQCRYLARMAWLKTEIPFAAEDILSCPEQDQWKKNLGVSEIYLIFAASDLSSAASSFGHTFLRLHNPKNTGKLALLDYGVNYAAATGSEVGALYALKGLFGSYPGTYSMQPYHQKIREYTNLEGRDLWEYKLHLNPQEVDFIIDHLLEVEGSYAPYYFSDDNCSEQILELIEVAKPDLELTSRFHDFVIPLDTVKVLNSQWLLEGENLRNSLQAEWHARYKLLNHTQKNAVKNIIKANSLADNAYLLSSPKEKAETLEASLSYLALSEYREQKEKKEEKYSLSLARAKLGAVTDPVNILNPTSPLLSPDSSAFYLTYGQEPLKNFYSLKWHRGFHDLLSDDSGLTPFSQLDFLSIDLHYYPVQKNWDLQQFVFLNIISTSPWTEFEHPLSWKIDIGTEPKLAPYFNGGLGAAVDISLPRSMRWAFFAITENSHLLDIAHTHLGIESLFINNWTKHWKSLLDAKYLFDTIEGRAFGDISLGLSYSFQNIEYRFEDQVRDNKTYWKLSLIF